MFPVLDLRFLSPSPIHVNLIKYISIPSKVSTALEVPARSRTDAWRMAHLIRRLERHPSKTRVCPPLPCTDRIAKIAKIEMRLLKSCYRLPNACHPRSWARSLAIGPIWLAVAPLTSIGSQSTPYSTFIYPFPCCSPVSPAHLQDAAAQTLCKMATSIY